MEYLTLSIFAEGTFEDRGEAQIASSQGTPRLRCQGAGRGRALTARSPIVTSATVESAIKYPPLNQFQRAPRPRQYERWAVRAAGLPCRRREVANKEREIVSSQRRALSLERIFDVFSKVGRPSNAILAAQTHPRFALLGYS
ncbi:hypothetical protein BJY52DRAFT_1227087 [Lactarius psammicola]|nr:hypothetical protein BJY52DRAFT_1227087 [Lactarius psammicola]